MPRPWLATTAVVVLLVVLQHGLPAETFFSGDSGVKLIGVINALRHPSHPLEIPVPVADGHPLPYLDPFFIVHGDHSHAVTSELFPMVTAPFYAWLGARGLYVLPAIGAAAMLLAWAWIAVMLDRRRRPALVILVLAVSSPLLFYALEFWEHAPAFGAASIGLALLLSSGAGGGSHPHWSRAVAGLCFGLAFLLRPEGGLFALASLACAAMTIPALRTSASAAEVLAGFMLAVLPLSAYNLAHFGSLTGPQVSANADLLLSGGWLETRWVIARTWLITVSRNNLAIVAPPILLAGLQLFRRYRLNGARFLVLLSAADVVLVLVSAPNDGGAQWGPRYLLFAYGPLGLLVADSLQMLPAARGIGTTMIVVAVLAGGWMQRASYKSLRTTKFIYGHVLQFVRETPPADRWIVTDLWWLDQIAASATDRQFLYAASPADFEAIRARLGEAGVTELTVISSLSESPTPLLRQPVPGCTENHRRHIPERDLTAITLLCHDR
jgi:hypothetical protein